MIMQNYWFKYMMVSLVNDYLSILDNVDKEILKLAEGYILERGFPK